MSASTGVLCLEQTPDDSKVSDNIVPIFDESCVTDVVLGPRERISFTNKKIARTIGVLLGTGQEPVCQHVWSGPWSTSMVCWKDWSDVSVEES